MTASILQFPKQQTLHQRIDRLLDFVPEIRIRKLEHGSVKVNDIVIDNRYGAWTCKGENFYRRKSAVGYALCLLRNEMAKAKEIKQLDRKLKTDIDFYHYHLRGTNQVRKNIMSHRISADMPMLHEADAALTQLLKTISV
jgi:hypothetical protein